jgi:hypothetical protein
MTYHQGHFGDLLIRINKLHLLMITSGQQYGLGSLETLQYSEELDELIIQFQLENR